VSIRSIAYKVQRAACTDVEVNRAPRSEAHRHDREQATLKFIPIKTETLLFGETSISTMMVVQWRTFEKIIVQAAKTFITFDPIRRVKELVHCSLQRVQRVLPTSERSQEPLFDFACAPSLQVLMG
jgi:hypothetical protein